MDFGNETSSKTLLMDSTVVQNSLTDVHDLDQCISALTNLKGNSNALKYYLRQTKYTILSFNNYHQRVEELYLNTSTQINEIMEHVHCSDVLDEATRVLDLFERITELAVNMTKSDTFSKASSYGLQMLPLFKDTEMLFLDETLWTIDENVEQKCNWLNQNSGKIQDEDNGFQEEFKTLEELSENSERLYESMALLFNNLNKELSKEISIFIEYG